MVLGLVLFFLGASVGSFINVLVGRFGKEKKINLSGRSRCDSCRRQLAWWENLPIISFFLLRGRCRTCHSPIPWEYPVVELATGLIYFLIFNFQFSIFKQFFLALIVATLLIIIFLFDFHYQIIPDWTVILLVFLAISYHFPSANLLTGVITAGFFFLLHLITRGRGMGLGDVKFSFFMGIFLGWPRIVLALYLAFLTGAIVGVILVLGKKKKFGQQIAFGPFLVLSTFIAWFGGNQLIDQINQWLIL